MYCVRLWPGRCDCPAHQAEDNWRWPEVGGGPTLELRWDQLWCQQRPEPGPEPELVSSCSVSALSESSPQPSPGRLPGHREWRDQSSAGSHSALSPGQAMFGSLVISPWRCCHTGAPGGAGQCNIWPGLASGHQRERGRAQITGHGGGALCPEPQSWSYLDWTETRDNCLWRWRQHPYLVLMG